MPRNFFLPSFSTCEPTPGLIQLLLFHLVSSTAFIAISPFETDSFRLFFGGGKRCRADHTRVALAGYCPELDRAEFSRQSRPLSFGKCKCLEPSSVTLPDQPTNSQTSAPRTSSHFFTRRRASLTIRFSSHSGLSLPILDFGRHHLRMKSPLHQNIPVIQTKILRCRKLLAYVHRH